MGYLIVLVLGGALLLVLFAGLVSGAKELPTGKVSSDEHLPESKPSADAPTPAKTVVDSNRQVENAQRHTPSA